MTDTPKTEAQKAGAIIVLRGLAKLVALLFAVFVGTAMVLDLVNTGPTWGNVPWLIFCVWLLLRAGK
jgi:hypothetical protein